MRKRKNKRKATSGKERHSILKRLALLADFPEDVVLGVPTLTMTGQIELRVENYRGILEYTDTLVRVKIKTGQLRVCGSALQVAYYREDEMKITGCITSIEYQQ